MHPPRYAEAASASCFALEDMVSGCQDSESFPILSIVLHNQLCHVLESTSVLEFHRSTTHGVGAMSPSPFLNCLSSPSPIPHLLNAIFLLLAPQHQTS
ncbi:hypothetical protein RIF29_25374 [Crotalaria pallida]|uniref:Uncharacterized protein n=1 Tax=Crotalaria pallida TaxID=3830 RepID=A0AAN9EM58_CROPI